MTSILTQHGKALCRLSGIIGALIIVAASLSAQETEIPMDDSGRVFLLTAEMARSAGLYTDVEGFVEARLFQQPDSTCFLEISTTVDGRTVRHRRVLSTEQVSALRMRISQTAARTVRKDTTAVDRSGRSAFLQGMIGLSLSYYGFAFPIAVESEQAEVSMGLYLVGGALSYVIASASTAEGPVTRAQAAAFTYHATRGAFQGTAVYCLIAGENSSLRWAVPVGAVGSALLGTEAFNSVGEMGTPLGEIDTKGVFENFGILAGIGAAYLIRSGDAFDVAPQDLRLLSGSILAGSVAGYAVGSALTDSYRYTSGDAQVIQTIATIGAFAAFTLLDVAGNEPRKPFVMAGLTGGLGGLGLGAVLCAHSHYPEDDGTSVRLASSAGVVFGLGVAYLVSKEPRDRTPFLVLGTAGAIGGFLIASSGADRVSDETAYERRWELHVNPVGLAVAAMSSKRPADGWSIPLASLSIGL